MFLEIYGTKGALKWSLMDADWLDYYDNTLPDRDYGGCKGFTRIECVARYPAPAGKFLPYKNAVGWDRAHMHSLYNFLKCVSENVAPEPSLERGARVQELIAALREADARRGFVSL